MHHLGASSSLENAPKLFAAAGCAAADRDGGRPLRKGRPGKRRQVRVVLRCEAAAKEEQPQLRRAGVPALHENGGRRAALRT